MAKPTTGPGTPQPTLPTHGASTLPSVEVDSYNVEIEDEDGFVGDRASKSAFRQILDDVRKLLREAGEDPLGDKPSDDISKKKLDALLANGDSEAAAVVQSAVEEFARQLAGVIRRFLRLKAWRDTEIIVVGGGFRGSRVGELSVARAGILLKADGINVDLALIHNHPDEAGLMGAAHLLPAWMVEGYDGILAVDVGGTNIRAGIVDLQLSKAKDLSKAKVAGMELWRHQDEKGIDREDAVEGLVEMLTGLISASKKEGLRLAPVIGIGCPGVILEDGSIERGAQNLPGNWESSKFNLPQAIREKITHIGEHETMVVMHNDAVVQGLSELPYLKDRRRWGVLTIGTGLGNARFSTRKKGKAKASAPKRRSGTEA
jgi:predicted NBD/HSP70 family sugar kinase